MKDPTAELPAILEPVVAILMAAAAVTPLGDIDLLSNVLQKK